MYVTDTSISCGVYQLVDLGDLKGETASARAIIALGSYGDSLSKSSYTILFSDNIENGNGAHLAAELKKNKLGRVRALGIRINPTHNSKINIWEWKLNKKAAALIKKQSEIYQQRSLDSWF